VNVAEDRRTPADEVQRLYNETESEIAKAMEELVSRDSFAALVVRMTENVMGVAHIANGALDLLIRNTRLAGRADLVKLGRQMARTEDKLERVLQEIEQLQARVDALGDGARDGASNGDAASTGSGSRRRSTQG
jgi:hypothetical protein